MRLKKSILLILSIILALKFPSAQSLTDVEQSYINLDLKKLRSQLENIISSPQTPKDLAEALLFQANLEWRFDQDFKSAHTTINRGLKGLDKHYDFYTLLTRMEEDSGRFDEAKKAALLAQKSAESEVDKQAAEILFCKISISEVLQRHRNPSAGPGNADPLLNQTSLMSCVVALSTIVKSEFGLLEPSRLLIKAGLLTDDGEAALKGISSYYSHFLYECDKDILGRPLETLNIILPSWKGPESSPKRRAELVTALAGIKMFEEAALAARDPRIEWEPSPQIRNIISYADFIRHLEETINSYYRAAVVESPMVKEYEDKIYDTIIELWNNSLFPEEKVSRETFNHSRSSYMSRFIERIGRDFNAYFRLSGSSRAKDLFFGHEVTNKALTIEQYGYSVPVHFILLDTMVSFGYRSWAWDFRSQVGGWARDKIIHIIRPGFAGRALQVWNSLNDPEKQKDAADQIAEDSVSDWERAANDPHAYLPGLRARITRNYLREIMAKARQGNESDMDIRKNFISIFNRNVIESMCLAHEGRHIIDHELLNIHNSSSLEFRAKLSETVFSPYPKFILGLFISPNIGGPGGHGQANLEIMKRLVAWIKDHADEIPGLDPEKPLLPQADLLTVQQIRAAFRSWDPLVSGSEK